MAPRLANQQTVNVYGPVDAVGLGGMSGGTGARSGIDYRPASLAETAEVCDLRHFVLLYAGVDPFLCRQKSAADARDGLDHQRGVRAGDRNYRFTGRARNDQSF